MSGIIMSDLIKINLFTHILCDVKIVNAFTVNTYKENKNFTVV